MSTQLIICLVIFVLTCVGYMTGVWSLGTVAMTSMLALTVTGCLSAKEALTYIGNNNVVMIGAMAVVAAGFNKTQFCANLATGISKIAKGSLTKVLLAYCLLATLLSQCVQSPVVVFAIVAPLCMASAESMNISKSQIALPLGVVAIASCCALPFGMGATQATELNGYITAYFENVEGFDEALLPVVNFLDPMIARLPMLIVSIIFCALVMPKFCPKYENSDAAAGKGGVATEKLPALQEWAGIIIFFGTAVLLCLQASVLKAYQIWQICLLGAVLMVMFGVLKPKEAVKAVPFSMLFLVAGALAMAAALAGTGAGDWIGGGISKLVMAVNNNYVVGLIFFVIPFVLTQFMSNRGTMLIFIPIAIATAYNVGGSPVGLIILIQQACLTAFLTPMATAAVPYMMEYGSYTTKDMLKGGWLYSIIAIVVCVGWIMTLYPLL